MTTVAKKRLFYINSGNQLSSTSNTFSQDLDIQDWVNFDHVTVTQISLPISYYLVQQGQNTFTLVEGAFSTVVTIPVGNYNVTSFQSVITDLLNTATKKSYVYSVSFPSNTKVAQTGLFLFKCVGGQADTVQFVFSTTSPVNQLFGMNDGSTNTFTAGYLSSTNVVDFTPEPTVYLHSNICGGSEEADDILAAIYQDSTTPPFGILSWTNPAPLETSKVLASQTKSVTFSLTNESGLPIYLNGVNLVFTMMLYKRSDFEEKSLKYYEYVVRKDLALVKK